ncbi:HtrA protease/chaperone protein [hydrothermal vent metagenome]|uniref:Probable periplasmic serine endoprotease DegP-like n=1 Tax=hydrothermal vent metagenome TaxID=652676 RepID=A0A3B0WTI9_9ZZZZ
MKKPTLFASLLVGVLFIIQPVVVWAESSAKPSASLAASFGLPDFVTLVEENHQVVVNISTTKEVTKQSQLHPQFKGLPDEMLRYFFGVPQSKLDEFRGGNRSTPKSMPKKRPHSLGSGFIISKDGYILTNHHVVEGADEIIVTMRDRKELKAEVIGSDKRTDVALLKVKASDLPFAKIGSRKNLKVGQWVLAIGEPFGLDYTVTHGIISALGRALPNDTYVPFIQTDVPINPGNSGGPLFNLAGEVVGINSQIYSSSGGAMGLSFSIPIDIAMNVVEQLKANGEVVRGYLGVLIQEVTSDLSKSFGLERPNGALVGEVYPDTPAEKAGIQAGDIILTFDGKSIHKSADLPPLVGITTINKLVKVKILRQGELEELEVALAALDSEDQMVTDKKSHSGNHPLGANVEDLDQATLRDLKIPFGVGIRSVFGDPAESAGLRQGDVLVTIDFKPVKSVKALKKLLKSLPKNRSLPVRVIREGRSLFLPLILKD